MSRYLVIVKVKPLEGSLCKVVLSSYYKQTLGLVIDVKLTDIGTMELTTGCSLLLIVVFSISELLLILIQILLQHINNV